MLWLKGADRPAEIKSTLDKAASEFSININPMVRVLEWQHKKTRPSGAEMEHIFEASYSTIDHLALIVDKLEV